MTYQAKTKNGKKIQIHADLCAVLHDLYVHKNNDYGDSFAKVRAEYPNAIAIRLMDKLERVKQLLKPNHQTSIVNESLDDTLLDLANYCLLELTERKYERTPSELAYTNSDAPMKDPGMPNPIKSLEHFE